MLASYRARKAGDPDAADAIAASHDGPLAIALRRWYERIDQGQPAGRGIRPMRTSDRQPTVLGLCSFTHDSAAALIAGGRLTGMAEEERLSGVKHTREYPAAAVQWLLDDAGLAAADVDIVAYNFAGHRYLAGIAGTPGHLLPPATRSRALPRAASFAVIHHRFRQRMKTLQGLFPNARVRCVPHHMAHGIYAFAASGFSEAAVLIIDSLGETCTTSIGSGMARPGGDVRYRIRESISDPASLGYAYGAVTAAPWLAARR